METAISVRSPWTPCVKILFRFFFVYFVLYVPSYLGVQFGLFFPWHGVVTWAGHSIFDTNIAALPNDSGDTTWNYVHVFLVGLISLFATTGWSLMDRKRMDYDNLLFWLLILLRYYLLFILVGFGFVKVIKTQFQFPTVEQLTTHIGQMSPMRLLWMFMGYSKTYNLFTGGGEVLAAVLLCFRRTSLLGALIAIAIMTNVLILNLSYDVPEKLLSIHMIVACVVIVAPQFSRLFNFFVLNKTTAPENIQPMFTSRKAKLYHGIAKGIVIAVIFVPFIYFPLKKIDTLETLAPAKFDVYSIEEHKVNGVIISEDEVTRRWEKLYVMPKSKGSVQYMDGAKIHWNIAFDTVARTIDLCSLDSTTIYRFQYAKAEDNLYRLKGKLYEDSIQMYMRKTIGEFPLLAHGFHWINEYPFNR